MFKIRRKIIALFSIINIAFCLFLYLYLNNTQNQINDKKYETIEKDNYVLEPPKLLQAKTDEFYKNDSTINLVPDPDNCNYCLKQKKTAPPQSDIQMLDLYEQLPFDNLNGGSWKQGWNIQLTSELNKNKLKVFVVPHSHNDPGWLYTFDDYYDRSTEKILSNALSYLAKYPKMKFIWAEISYFSRFYDSLNNTSKDKIKKLVENGQLEFVTGGWVMTDEANSHWYSVLLQLTEGQMWLKKHLNVTPISSWAIDPFGHSSSIPYILKKSGFENLLIQRTHYSVKKYLASTKQLEFRWRQNWDRCGETELFTHMMPFSSYNIPHSCGPDPKVCSQFDFKKLSPFGLKWLLNSHVQEISDLNIAKKAHLLVDQWRKKSVLYKTRSVIIPLGDDFRYKERTEWQAQKSNYQKLFNYINKKSHFNTEAKFGTLQEYFDSVRYEKNLSEFPILNGDFFTYADRDDNYWSGYYTSRPYHKRMERVLLHYVRSAEMMRVWHNWSPQSKLDEKLEYARQQLSLFQHHDGITGTSTDYVVEDYYLRMKEAIKNCKFVIQQAAYRLLTAPKDYQPNFQYEYFYIDDERWPGSENSRKTITLSGELPYKHIVIQNSFTQWRQEVVEFYISTPFVRVEDFQGNSVTAQISPVWSWIKDSNWFIGSHKIPFPSRTKFRLLIYINVPPLGLVRYMLFYDKNLKKSLTSYSRNTILTKKYINLHLGDNPIKVHIDEPQEFNLKNGDGPIVKFNVNGLMNSIAYKENSDYIEARLQFFKYGTRYENGSSGAYLFLPNGPATHIPVESTTIILTEGILESSVVVGLLFVTHSIILRYDSAIEIRNLVDISKMDNTELVMRISSGIKNDDVFYTDLNALQIIKRKRLSKIPLQANYYPVPSSIYIEDEENRLTILSAQSLGGSSLKNGQIEIMQDRRLIVSDERGLGQGVMDNKPVQHIFRLLLESVKSCTKRNSDYAGFLTAKSYKELQYLTIPLNKLIWNKNDWFLTMNTFGKSHEALEDGIEVPVLRNLDSEKHLNYTLIGIVIHKTLLEECNNQSNRAAKLDLIHLLNLKNQSEIYSSHLTLLKPLKKLTEYDMNICPMDSKGFIIKRLLDN